MSKGKGLPPFVLSTSDRTSRRFSLVHLLFLFARVLFPLLLPFSLSRFPGSDHLYPSPLGQYVAQPSSAPSMVVSEAYVVGTPMQSMHQQMSPDPGVGSPAVPIGIPTNPAVVGATSVPGQPTQYIVVNQPAMAWPPHQSPDPVLIECGTCGATAVTEIRREAGACTILSCFGICLICPFGCCLIPFFVPDFLNTKHYCSNCKTPVGQYDRSVTFTRPRRF
ncbi:unnamed protein product [Phaeothamnion confervicola]